MTFYLHWGHIFWPLLLVFIIVTTSCLRVGYDATDDYQNARRSGLTLYTDYGTGVQYVRSGWFFGNLTPRLGKDGKPVIVEVKP